MPQWELDQGAYSCLRLSFMIASAIPLQRTAFERMLTADGGSRHRGSPCRSSQALLSDSTDYRLIDGVDPIADCPGIHGMIAAKANQRIAHTRTRVLRGNLTALHERQLCGR